MMTAIFVPLASLVLCLLGAISIHTVLLALLSGAIAAALIYLSTFFYYFLRSDLSDPVRTIKPNRKRKMISFLSPYGINKPAGEIPRRFNLIYCRGVSDKESFGNEIQDVMWRAGWAANLFDDDSVSEPTIHTRGLWVYGKGSDEESPTTANLLVDAFEVAGFKVHIDQEHWGIPGTNLVIGRRD